VLIVTGFLVADGMPETDGPPGAAVLGRALRRLGARVGYTTDAAVVPILSAALRALGEAADVIACPAGADAGRALLVTQRPTHLVAIERPGRGRTGDYLNARGASVAAWNAPLDDLFCSSADLLGSRRGSAGREARGSGRRAVRRRPVTVGIGDGGNEIGMGNVRARLAREGPLMARIASVVRVDHLVVAGVSNWGAYGVVAHLGRLTGRGLLHTPTDERRLIEACVAAGAVDGLTRRREATVDALDADTHASMVRLLGLSWGDSRARGERS
jgi:hypothetical protein